jgi:hypothetical protein
MLASFDRTYDFRPVSRHATRVESRPSFVKSYRYRVYTENVNLDGIYTICDQSLKGYTICPTHGVWESTHEASLYIEYIGESCDATIKAIAESIKVRNSQSAVLVTRESIDSVLI